MTITQGCGSQTPSTAIRTDAELFAWLCLHHTPRLGPKTLTRLLEHFHSVTAILENAGEIPNAQLREALSQPDRQAIDRDLEWLAQADDHGLVTLADPACPELLQTIADPPLVLFTRGKPDCLAMPQLAIVGSRNPTRSGLDTAQGFAEALAAAGITITSGLALGIDAAAHAGALAVQQSTVAVMGCGLDRVYPARHQGLAEQIREQGVLVSEYSPGTRPVAANFPRRNRIISGLSLGVLVVEAAIRSGSLITARLAGEQGREVFAIPGSIHNPLSRGSHRLIREGARLVETTRDILDELGSLLGTFVESASASMKTPHDTGSESPILAYIDYDPVDFDTLIARSGLTPEVVSAMLSSLEIQGCIAALPGGRYCRS